MSHKILLVDDDLDILDLLEYNLVKEGFTVKRAENGVKALRVAQSFLPDLILLDVMMPKMDGVETCIELRKNDKLKSSVIAFLTARSEDYSQIAGLDAGADDYINKPVKPRVLISKVNALLRRPEKKQSLKNEVFTFGNFVIDKSMYVATNKGQSLNLPKKEFELLALLASNPGKVFKREEIMDSVWGNDVIVGDRTIDVHIRKLREKIGEGYIKTIKGVGYKLDV